MVLWPMSFGWNDISSSCNNGWRVRLYFQNPWGAWVTYQLGGTKKKKTNKQNQACSLFMCVWREMITHRLRRMLKMEWFQQEVHLDRYIGKRYHVYRASVLLVLHNFPPLLASYSTFKLTLVLLDVANKEFHLKPLLLIIMSPTLFRKW